MKTILTVGHSNHSLNDFMEMLHRHGVKQIADVRSHPRSRFAPHFNRDTLQTSLKLQGIGYRFMGTTLGGRPAKDELYTPQGRADYRRMAQVPAFIASTREVGRMGQETVTALMCSEKRPEECHRTLLVAHQLNLMGFPSAHIRPDWEIPEPHQELLARLAHAWGETDPQGAADRQASKYAFKRPTR